MCAEYGRRTTIHYVCGTNALPGRAGRRKIFDGALFSLPFTCDRFFELFAALLAPFSGPEHIVGSVCSALGTRISAIKWFSHEQ